MVSYDSFVVFERFLVLYDGVCICLPLGTIGFGSFFPWPIDPWPSTRVYQNKILNRK